MTKKIETRSGRTPAEEAQAVIYDALEAPDRKRRVSLARKALEISRDCADAWVLLAQESNGTSAERRALYENGVQAGERALGREMFEENVGHFWGIFETRPYMRARHGLASVLRDAGDFGAAIEHFVDMLRLCPGDNMGVRYLLVTTYLEASRDRDAERLLKQFTDDAAATWAFTRALLAFRKGGDTAPARKKLKEATAANRHIRAYLLGKKKLPRDLPDYVGIGDKNEAIAYAVENLAAWKASPGALEWLASQ